MSLNTDSDSPLALLSIIFPATIAMMMPFVSPVVIGGLVDTVDWTEKDAGILVSTELGVLALTAVAGLLWLDRIPWKFLSLFGLALMLSGNLFAVFFYESSESLYVSRVAAGIGAGVLTTLAYSGLARSANPHRNYGLFTMSQMAMAMLLLGVLPVLIAGESSDQASFVTRCLAWLGVATPIGIEAFFIIMLTLSAVGFALSLAWFPGQSWVVSPTTDSHAQKIYWLLPGLMLLSIFALMLSQQAFWSYSERIGVSADLNRSSIGTVLALGALAGFVGAFCATLVGNALPRPLVIALIFSTHLSALSLFLSPLNIYIFTLGVFLHKFSWNFGVPYQLGMLAEIENSGRAAVLSVVISAFGVSAGAGFAAIMVGDYGYRGMILGVMMFALLYTVLLLLVHFRLKVPRQLEYAD